MKEFKVITLVRECAFSELSPQERELIEAAKDAASNAYAPYSGFHVGAAILLDNGKIVRGSNQENAAYPSGLCAERTAAFYASSSNPGIAMKKIAVAAWQNPGEGKEHDEGFIDNPISPCGGCRQALAEYEHLYGKIEVLLYGRNKIYILPSVESLLPFSFMSF